MQLSNLHAMQTIVRICIYHVHNFQKLLLYHILNCQTLCISSSKLSNYAYLYIIVILCLHHFHNCQTLFISFSKLSDVVNIIFKIVRLCLYILYMMSAAHAELTHTVQQMQNSQSASVKLYRIQSLWCTNVAQLSQLHYNFFCPGSTVVQQMLRNSNGDLSHKYCSLVFSQWVWSLTSQWFLAIPSVSKLCN